VTFRLPLVLTIALLLIPVSAAAELRLKAVVTVDDGVLRIGDLFDGAGKLAAREIGPAPMPGATAIYRANHLAAIARAHALSWQPHSTDLRVKVTRSDSAALKLDVNRMVTDALTTQGIDGPIEVDLARHPAKLAALGGGADLTRLRVNRLNGRFTAEVVDDSNMRVKIAGRFYSVLNIPTPTRALTRGKTISSENLTWTETRIPGSPRDLALTMDEVVGMSVRRTVRPGDPLRHGDLDQPALVTKGGLVTMTLKAPGMLLSGTGRALEDGGLGDMVQIMNTRSKRTVEGVVVGVDSVEIHVGRKLAAAK